MLVIWHALAEQEISNYSLKHIFSVYIFRHRCDMVALAQNG